MVSYVACEGERRASIVEMYLAAEGTTKERARLVGMNRRTIGVWAKLVHGKPRERWAEVLLPMLLKYENPNHRRLWRSMRIMRAFSARDLALTASLGASAVRRYLSALVATGFVRHHRASGVSRYLLVRNSGPRTPVLRRNRDVWDPNTGRTYRYTPDSEVQS